ncbi:MAG: prepilin peptidase [bacterium]
MFYIIAFLVFFLGISVGSFLNVCIYRLPNSKSILFPSSHCPKCKHKLFWYELIPILGFILLRGRCSKCKTAIGLQYPAIELLTGFLFFWLYSEYGLGWYLYNYMVLFSFLIIMFFVYLKHKEIPTNLFITGVVLGFLITFFGVKADLVSIIFGIIISGIFPILASLIFKIITKILNLLPETKIIVTTVNFLSRNVIEVSAIKTLIIIGTFAGCPIPIIAFLLATILKLLLAIILKGKTKTNLPNSILIISLSIIMLLNKNLLIF